MKDSGIKMEDLTLNKKLAKEELVTVKDEIT